MPAARDAADRVRRARLPLRLRLEGLPRDGRGLRPPAARGARRVAAAAAADLHARRRRRSRGTTRTSTAPRPSSCRRGALRRGRAGRARALRVRLGVRARPRDHPRRHEARVRSRPGGRLVLGDEAFTPDSSRFWPADDYRPGATPPSFDKQFVRDYCESARLGQDPARPGAARRRRRRHARALRRGVRAADRASRSTTTSPIRAWSAREGDRARPAEAGHPRPAGPGRRELAAPPRLRRRRGARRPAGRRRPRRPTTATRRSPSSSRCASSC